MVNTTAYAIELWMHAEVSKHERSVRVASERALYFGYVLIEFGYVLKEVCWFDGIDKYFLVIFVFPENGDILFWLSF